MSNKPMTDAEIGAALRDERKFLRIRQEAVAERLKVTRQVVSYMETGKRPVRASELIILCNLYRVTPNGILGF